MQTVKFAAFWLLFLAFVAALVWHEPLNQVGTPVHIIFPICLIYWLINKWRSRSRLKLPPNLQSRFSGRPRSATTNQPGYADLLRMCLGDTAKAERLILFEQAKRPGITRTQAINLAADRLKYDKQR